ncbi:MAG: PAS domain S-box protein, partial [Ignavibacteriae bacterium]|nr:PAS domain S-box protein [Ignavibacteriota bacterium]
LRSKEERISLLLNAFEESSAAIAIVNEDFRIIEANHQFCQIVKTDREKIIDEYLVDVQFKGELNEYFTMIKNELQLYSKFRGELNYDNKILLIYVTPSSTGSKFNGYLFIEVDITEQKKLEEQLVKSEKLAALGKMAAVLAHEIKTPLTSIKMNTDIIAAELKLNKDEKENIAIIQTEINQLNNLVKDVLQFSRQMELDISEFNLFDLVEKIKHQLNSKLKSKNISLLNNLGKIDLMADRQRLTQVFLNLIDNSIEAISSNGKIELKSFIDEDKNNVQILVIDSGTGISDDIKVFEPFYTTKTSGTGLGLSITQKIVEQHKGKINLVSSKPGETIFEIVFPLNELNKTEKNNFVQ